MESRFIQIIIPLFCYLLRLEVVSTIVKLFSVMWSSAKLKPGIWSVTGLARFLNMYKMKLKLSICKNTELRDSWGRGALKFEAIPMHDLRNQDKFG